MVGPTVPHHRLLDVVEKALKGGVDILQLLTAGQKKSKPVELTKKLLDLANGYNVPLIINNDIQLAKEVGAHGVHMDRYSVVPADARKALGEQSIVGYTVGNDLERVKWAETVGADYVSFCAVFPTTSATQCEMIPLHTIRLAKSLTRLPVFASGGINLSNVHSVLEAGVDGIAVISSILKAQNPEKTAESFKEIINKYKAKIR